MQKNAFRLAVDIGGTFTDTVLIDQHDAILATTKTPTTPDNPTDGAMAGVRQVLREAGVLIGDVTGFIHGTTLATNALIERRGARVATITTKGFRDILEIAYERRYSQYDINIEKPDLIVPRRHCFTIGERMRADGSVLQPLDRPALDPLLEQLDHADINAVAICLLHSYANPSHEQELRDLLGARRPDLTISISSEVSPEAREFERLTTTIANAYIQPMMAGYLSGLADVLKAEGLNCPVLMMTSGGGMTTIETAAKYPIRLVESGPAGGAILAAEAARLADEPSVLSFDMGGTTAKLCLIDNFQPQTSRRFEISRAERFIKGSGMPVRIPVIEMIEIGAGGGSIAGVDRLERLTVGPHSAGSEPGPAAFGKGGDAPTVTDADVTLGLIEPGQFAEGRLQIDADAASAALLAGVGAPLGIDAIAAAEGVAQIVDESMASAGRMHAVESGKDLNARLMIALGGNGPLHATRVARRAGVTRILIPNSPGVGSAVGFLFAPVSFEIVRSKYMTLQELEIDALNGFFRGLIDEATAVVSAGAPGAELFHRRVAFMRYHGQGHEIEIPLPERGLTRRDIKSLQQSFEDEYQRQFSRAVPGMTIEILNWVVNVSTKSSLSSAASNGASAPINHRQIHPTEHRDILCDVTGNPAKAGLFQRHGLKPGDAIPGPALIVEPQTTTFVSLDFALRVLADGALLLTRNQPESQS